jgi:NAD(P)-dependent dehydrogenase (short-subunit alcohol dehydrogenase family)
MSVKSEPKPPMPPQQQPKPGLDSRMDPRPRYQAPDYKAADKLKDKVAIVTGGDSGIGKAVANLYAREGADVAIVYLKAEQSDAEETKKAVEAAGRRCLLIPGDVTDSKFCRKAVERTVKEFGRLDILVNNAAYQQRQQKLEDVTDKQLDTTFKTNIYGYFYMAKAALPHLKRGSAIVNCGSITGLEGNKTLIDYAATKGAIHAFTKSLAQNLADKGIRVNCVAPGPVWTPFIPSGMPPEKVAQFGKDSLFGRPAQPAEIAPLFVLLASQEGSYLTGEVFGATGGKMPY